MFLLYNIDECLGGIFLEKCHFLSKGNVPSLILVHQLYFIKSKDRIAVKNFLLAQKMNGAHMLLKPLWVRIREDERNQRNDVRFQCSFSRM